MSAVSKESEDEAEAAGTSSMMESTMMEGEEYYNPDPTVAWSEKVAGGEQLCRICAGANEYLIPIFSGEGLEHQLGMKIEKHLPIQVLEQDKLPVQVCYQCASTLIAWHDLVVGCVEAEKKLQQLYQQENAEEEEEEDDFGDDDRTELFNDPVDSEMAEDPLEPSTSTSTATRSTRSPRKKTVTRAKPKLKMTLVKTPAALPKSPPKLLQPKEEQVEADPATERTCTREGTAARSTTDNSLGAHTMNSTSPKLMKIYLTSKQVLRKTSKVAHILCYALRKGLSNKIVYSSCTACGKNKIVNSELITHIHLKCVAASAKPATRFTHSTPCITLNEMDEENNLCLADRLTPQYDEHVHAKSVTASELPPTVTNFIEDSSPQPFILMNNFPCEDVSIVDVHESGKMTVDNSCWTCAVCGKKFEIETRYENHKLVHERQKCQICNKYLLTYKQQVNHYKEHKGMSTVLPPEWIKHIARKRKPRNKNKTKQNGKIREKGHDKVTPALHFCSICRKVSSTKQGLNEHMRTHTGEKPYACKICGRSFSQSGSRNTHMRLIHKSGIVST